MTRSTRRIRTATGLLVALGASLVALGASADYKVKPTTVFLQMHPGYGGPEEQAGGPGTEQSQSAVFHVNGDTYVMTIYMSSDVSEEDRPWQGKCSTVKLSAKDSPKIVVDRKQISAYHGGDRVFNHPRMASNGGSYAVYMFGSDGNVTGNDPNNVATYAGVLDYMCNQVVEPKKVSTNPNNNDGAPEIVYAGNGWFTAGYLSTNNNDTSYALGLKLSDDGMSLEKMWQTDVVSPSNIGRPTIVNLSPTRSFFCAAQGDNRPPEDGIRCASLDVMTGDLFGSAIVAKSEPENKIYMNQPQLASLGNGRVALMVVQSDGAGKNNNNKGANKTHLYALTPNDQSIQEESHLTNIGPYQVHPTICSGKWGVTGETVIGMLDASPTGVGQPGLQLVHYDNITGLKPVDKFNDLWVVGFHGDSAYLANLYGENPNTQGRDFLRCMGDVPNPGYKVDGGFMPTVESFFLTPHSGRQANEPKNALFLSFVPGKVDEPVSPSPPEPVSTESSSTGGPASSSSSSGSSANPDEPRDPSDPTTLQIPGENKSGCACSAPGDQAPTNTPAALSLLGLALAVASRRRSRKE